MKIFDGVPIDPATLSPNWQGVIGAAMLFGKVLMEADKIRYEREARESTTTPAGPTTFADVMEQSGLKIPHLKDALAAFMGGTDEAEEVATLIVDLPDPAKLLREFTKQYRRQSTPATGTNGPIVTRPPASTATPPAEVAPSTDEAVGAAAAPKLATFRPEFTREGLAAAEAAKKDPAAPRPKLATFRPEFTSEGLAAAEAAKKAAVPEGLAASAAAAAPHPKLATFRPEFTREGLAAAKGTAKPAAPEAPGGTGRLLADALAKRLEALTLQSAAHEADLETRMRCAEAELAMLREEVVTLRKLGECPILFVVPSLAEAAAPSGEHDTMPDEVIVPTISATGEVAASSSDVCPPSDEAIMPTTPGPETDAIDGPPNLEADMIASVTEDAPQTTPLPAPGSDADLARAFAILHKFADEQQASYARDSERMRSLERKISTLRGQIEVERSHRTAGGHG